MVALLAGGEEGKPREKIGLGSMNGEGWRSGTAGHGGYAVGGGCNKEVQSWRVQDGGWRLEGVAPTGNRRLLLWGEEMKKKLMVMMLGLGDERR